MHSNARVRDRESRHLHLHCYDNHYHQSLTPHFFSHHCHEKLNKKNAIHYDDIHKKPIIPIILLEKTCVWVEEILLKEYKDDVEA